MQQWDVGNYHFHSQISLDLKTCRNSAVTAWVMPGPSHILLIQRASFPIIQKPIQVQTIKLVTSLPKHESPVASHLESLVSFPQSL